MFYDIDFNLRRLSNGNVSEKTNEAAMRQYLESLLLTRRGEKPFDVDFGTDIIDYLQESVNGLNAILIRDSIFDVAENYLDDIIIQKKDIIVNVNRTTRAYEVQIFYRNLNWKKSK